jgi:hypothetical protein
MPELILYLLTAIFALFYITEKRDKSLKVFWLLCTMLFMFGSCLINYQLTSITTVANTATYNYTNTRIYEPVGYCVGGIFLILVAIYIRRVASAWHSGFKGALTGKSD